MMRNILGGKYKNKYHYWLVNILVSVSLLIILGYMLISYGLVKEGLISLGVELVIIKLYTLYECVYNNWIKFVL